MATGDHFIGVDVGTGSARACIIDATGEIKAVATKDIKTWNDKPDYYEQSLEDIWSAVCHCCKQVVKEVGLDSAAVKGIGFDATCSLVALSEATEEPISVSGPEFKDNQRNIILWMDHRSGSQTDKINATKHKLLQYVGGGMSVEMDIPKALWLKENMPEELFKQCKFYGLVDALTHLATGAESRSYCSTVCKQGFVPVGVDGSIKGWQEDFLTAIGLPELCEDNFKRIGGVNGVNQTFCSAGQLVGTLCEKAAQEMGLAAGTKIGSGVIDAYAGWIGTVGARAKQEQQGEEHLSSSASENDIEQAFQRLAVVAGTSSCHLVLSRNPVFVPGVWGPYRDVLLEDYWMAEGGQSATGSLLHHVVTTHTAYDEAKKAADAKKQHVFEYLNNKLEEMRKDAKAPTISYLARHFFLVGDFHGNRSPISDPRMRGSVVGLSMDASVTGLALYYYAALEFIALQTRHIIESLNGSGHNVSSIYMSGGQSGNNILMRLIANVTGFPVLIARYVDAAVVLGAAMLGAKAASANENGETQGLWSIMTKMTKPGDAILPNVDEKEKKLLDVKYKVFLRMSKEQQEYRNMVDEALRD